MNIMLLITFASAKLLIYYLLFTIKPEIFPILLSVLLTRVCSKIKPNLLHSLWILSVIPPIKLFCAGLKELILAKGKGGNFPVLPKGGHMVASESEGALQSSYFIYSFNLI
jgi:hypothetical protein